jgi:hypothetical protein
VGSAIYKAFLVTKPKSPRTSGPESGFLTTMRNTYWFIAIKLSFVHVFPDLSFHQQHSFIQHKADISQNKSSTLSILTMSTIQFAKDQPEGFSNYIERVAIVGVSSHLLTCIYLLLSYFRVEVV